MYIIYDGKRIELERAGKQEFDEGDLIIQIETGLIIWEKIGGDEIQLLNWRALRGEVAVPTEERPRGIGSNQDRGDRVSVNWLSFDTYRIVS